MLSSESHAEKVLNSVMQWFENKGIKRGDPSSLKDDLRETKQKAGILRTTALSGGSSLLERRLKSKLSSFI